jgi:hypothetical protein
MKREYLNKNKICINFPLYSWRKINLTQNVSFEAMRSAYKAVNTWEKKKNDSRTSQNSLNESHQTFTDFSQFVAHHFQFSNFKSHFEHSYGKTYFIFVMKIQFHICFEAFSDQAVAQHFQFSNHILNIHIEKLLLFFR